MNDNSPEFTVSDSRQNQQDGYFVNRPGSWAGHFLWLEYVNRGHESA
ncbi:MAG: hypothetical protein P8J37_11215 [Fuerstiella sp.]|nr:hypothetical protein [Fuerstiella sp.]